jgi:hypothetical protein
MKDDVYGRKRHERKGMRREYCESDKFGDILY